MIAPSSLKLPSFVADGVRLRGVFFIVEINVGAGIGSPPALCTTPFTVMDFADAACGTSARVAAPANAVRKHRSRNARRRALPAIRRGFHFDCVARTRKVVALPLR